MNNSIVIPDFLNHLPVYRGYPVPYFVPKNQSGEYLLKYASAHKMNNCIKYHKCCVCFKPLVVGEYYFISGPMGFKTQTDSHPAMHKNCAEYSLKICPHLFFERTHRTSDEEKSAAWQITEKPKEFFLVHAKKIASSYPDGRTLVVKYSSIVSFERYLYHNGVLTKANDQPKEQLLQ